MSASPIDRRLIELCLLGSPEQAEESEFLEEYSTWKANGGPKDFEHKREAEHIQQFNNTDRLLRWGSPKPQAKD